MNNQPIRAYREFTTNIKNLPEGEYLTETQYSDTYAWRVIKRTPATITVQEVLVDRDPEWKPEFVPGGFAGHCTNQNEQTWLFAGFGQRTQTLRLVKSPYCGADKHWAHKGTPFIANGACRHYDYNF